jgi:nucleoside-diphosphate-sugar epimerase
VKIRPWATVRAGYIKKRKKGLRLFGSAIQGKTIKVMGNPDLPHTYTYVPDIGKALVTLGEREEALGQTWHLLSPQTVTTRNFICLVCNEASTVPHIQAAPGWMMNASGLFNSMFREIAEIAYEFEEPFILDNSCFTRTFGDIATPLAEAIPTTLNWYKSQPLETK